ncbi:MAG: 3-oxoacyl-ACP synthase, partial [Candidatus Binatia bacterium]
MLPKVLGIGAALPSRRIANADLERRVDTSDEWIQTRTGIRERRVIGAGESLLDLVEAASRQALERSGIEASALEAIVIGTVSGDYSFPAVACQLQQRLGLDKIAAFDVSAACTGFVYALSTASAHVRAGDFATVLVVGADTLSTMIDWNERRTCV